MQCDDPVAGSSGIPALGVCVGMQILFDRSEEGPCAGLSVLHGDVVRLRHATLPHIGWNSVRHSGDPLFEGIRQDDSFYFVHSFAAGPEGAIAVTDYGGPFAAAWRRGSLYGVQFHPEKSSTAGRRLLANFVRMAEETR